MPRRFGVRSGLAPEGRSGRVSFHALSRIMGKTTAAPPASSLGAVAPAQRLTAPRLRRHPRYRARKLTCQGFSGLAPPPSRGGAPGAVIALLGPSGNE